MTSHPDPTELRAYRARRLPPVALLRVDRHLAECADCRTALTFAGSGRGDAGDAPQRAAGTRPHEAETQALVGRVVSAGAHISFEQMAILVDERADETQRLAMQSHLDWCAMCRRELADLATQAPALRQPLARQGAAVTSGRAGAGHAADRRAQAPWRRWWAGWTHWAPGLAMAAVVAGVVLTVAVQDRSKDGATGIDKVHAPATTTPRNTETQSGTTNPSVASDEPTRPVASGTYDHRALDQLQAVSPAAAAAWAARDHQQLVRLLEPLVDNGQPTATAALASLYAQGLGVARDEAVARRLWQRAAQAGHPGAVHNLAVAQAASR